MLRVRVVWTGLPGLPGLSTYYFTGPETGPDAVQVKTAVADAIDAVKAHLVNDITATVQGTVDVINPANGELTSALSTADSVIIGTNVADPLPSTTQLLIQLPTTGIVAGRRVRGRSFIPGLSEAANDLGRPLSAVRTAFAAAFDPVANMGDQPWVVWARPRDVDPERDGSAHPVGEPQVWTEWAVLRSRRT